MNITVYLGASRIKDREMLEALVRLGYWIGESGHTLVYGGSSSGLMGLLAGLVIDSGGKVIGVEPESFVAMEYQRDDLDELIVTKNISERRSKMIELGDAFIAFPGGTGTLEEISEVISLVSLNELHKPCIIYNYEGFYEGLRDLLNKMIEKNLCTEEKLYNVCFLDTLEDIKNIIDEYNKKRTMD